VLIEAVGGQATDLEVLDQHVGVARQLANDLLPLGSRDIDGQRALVAVGAQEIGGLARRLAIAVGQPRRPPAARVVAAAGPLDLDYLGAEVGQQLTGPGAGENARQVEHAQMRQRAAAFRFETGCRTHWRLQKAAMPVCARPRIRACTSCVPS
jgi:hypothetical protein